MNSEIPPPPSLFSPTLPVPFESSELYLSSDNPFGQEETKQKIDKKLEKNHSKIPAHSKDTEDQKRKINYFFGDSQQSVEIKLTDSHPKNIENPIIDKSSPNDEKTNKEEEKIELGRRPNEDIGLEEERKRINDLFDDPEKWQDLRKMGSQSKNGRGLKIGKLGSPRRINKMDISPKFEYSFEMEEKMGNPRDIPEELKSPNPIIKYLRDSMNRSISIHKSIRRLGSREDEEEKGEGGELLRELVRNANREEMYEIKKFLFDFKNRYSCDSNTGLSRLKLFRNILFMFMHALST